MQSSSTLYWTRRVPNSSITDHNRSPNITHENQNDFSQNHNISLWNIDEPPNSEPWKFLCNLNIFPKESEIVMAEDSKGKTKTKTVTFKTKSLGPKTKTEAVTFWLQDKNKTLTLLTFKTNEKTVSVIT